MIAIWGCKITFYLNQNISTQNPSLKYNILRNWKQKIRQYAHIEIQDALL
jgi:hypothetical protein